tara:strand:+ start:280 stop:678 length:399 start_codon:yes stop_codon:yes gene_type:complete
MKITTQDVILYLRKVHPNISTKNLSIILGVSRQRTAQILQKNNLRTKTIHPVALCAHCGNPCGYKKYCNKDCFSQSRLVNFVCEECGISFIRSKGYANMRVRRNYTHSWCSKQCQGKTLGKLNMAHPRPRVR